MIRSVSWQYRRKVAVRRSWRDRYGLAIRSHTEPHCCGDDTSFLAQEPFRVPHATAIARSGCRRLCLQIIQDAESRFAPFEDRSHHEIRSAHDIAAAEDLGMRGLEAQPGIR